MESYSDYSNRLPRGRTYVRNGSVVDLQITPGTVVARVSGSQVYRTTITVKPVPKAKWQQICADCAGGIDSLVELLQGRLSKGVVDRLCRQDDGLFQVPKDIHFDCSCPDGASMCKHVAAVLYGVGARFDSKPELLFTLRQVDAAELLSKAGSGVVTAPAAGECTLAGDDVGALFGLEMEGSTDAATAAPTQLRAAAKPGLAAQRPLRDSAGAPALCRGCCQQAVGTALGYDAAHEHAGALVQGRVSWMCQGWAASESWRCCRLCTAVAPPSAS